MPEPYRITIYVGPPLAAALDGFENRSGRLNAVCERYLAIVEDVAPTTLAEGEWCLLCDILNGTVRDVDCARLLWAEVEGSAPNGMGEKWSVDVPALAAKIRGMSAAERHAILEVVDRFWLMHERPASSSWAERLTAAGAKLRLPDE